MMDCIRVTICLDIWIVALVMIITLIASALWFRSFSRSSVDNEAVSLNEVELSLHNHDIDGNSDTNRTLSKAQIYDLYSEFYAGMDEEDASNLDNYLERE